jgi:hypothetical protein
MITVRGNLAQRDSRLPIADSSRADRRPCAHGDATDRTREMTAADAGRSHLGEFLTHPGFILEPDLYGLAGSLARHDLRQALGEVF